MLSRWGNDRPESREASAKLLHTFLLSMHATPYIFSGDEIGMSNIKFDNIEDYRDIETLNWYKELQQDGEDTKKYLEGWKTSARDNSRTPFQWSNELNAGFSSGQPWITVNANFNTVNEASQENAPDSILNYFRKMIQLRKDNAVLIYGEYEILDEGHPQVYAYTRSLEGQKMLVMLNFSSKDAEFDMPLSVTSDAVLINNCPQLDSNQQKAYLKAYQAVIIKLE